MDAPPPTDSPPTSSTREEMQAGAKAALPLLLGVGPFGMICGITAVGIGLPEGLAAAMSVVIFAGASQLAALQLIAEQAPGGLIVLAAVIINLRFVMYSASLAPYFQHLSLSWKSLVAYLMTDQAYALSIVRYRRERPSDPRWYYLGAALTLWGTWQIGTVVGVVLGARVPASWSLEFALPLVFLVLLFPAIRGRSAAGAALAAALVALIGAQLPFNSGLLVASLSGVAVGLSLDRRSASGSEEA